MARAGSADLARIANVLWLVCALGLGGSIRTGADARAQSTDHFTADSCEQLYDYRSATTPDDPSEDFGFIDRALAGEPIDAQEVSFLPEYIEQLRGVRVPAFAEPFHAALLAFFSALEEGISEGLTGADVIQLSDRSAEDVASARASLQASAGAFNDVVEYCADASTALAPPLGRLFNDVEGTVDELGRIPLARLTFGIAAELPPDRLPAPFAVFVEAGSFRVSTNGIETRYDAGESFVVETGTSVAANNVGPNRGSWLVLFAYSDYTQHIQRSRIFPSSIACASCAPPGLTLRQLSLHNHVVERGAPARFTVDRIALEAGGRLESIDQGGSTPARRVLVVVETGAVQVIAGGAPMVAGTETESQEFDISALEELEVTSEDGATILVVRWGDSA